MGRGTIFAALLLGLALPSLVTSYPILWAERNGPCESHPTTIGEFRSLGPI